MIITPTPLPGLLIIEPRFFEDSRGGFYESWRDNEYRDAGISETFVQDNISISHKNVVRGLHFHHSQGQLMGVIRGRILDVVVDLRPHSPHFKQHFSMEMYSTRPQQLYMPQGFAHGFCVLSDEAILNYKCTRTYNAQDEKGVLWNDPELAIDWPITTPILSDRDRAHPVLKDVCFE